MRLLPNLIAAIGAMAMLAASSLPGGAHEGHEHESDAAAAPAPAPSPDQDQALEYFTDLPVTTQDGQTLRFYSDVLKDKVLLVSLFYTSCKGACPVTTAKMAAVQELLGEDFGRRIHFVSITVDPENDTPAVIRDYAAQFGARDGWLFLTGDQEDLRTIAYRLGHRHENVEAHPPLYLVADTRRGYWRKLMPNVATEPLAEMLRILADGA
ncbi:MAG TPA: SCO family protein [Afifellaceae bacterium]|nr:SCO family protein [Afifellaceae bacterium]